MRRWVRASLAGFMTSQVIKQRSYDLRGHKKHHLNAIL